MFSYQSISCTPQLHHRLHSSISPNSILTTFLYPHTHTLPPAPISGDSSIAFKTAIDGQIIVLLMTLCVVLGINTDGFKDPSGNPVWSLIRMKLLPQLSQKLTTYDATEKKTVPPEQSTAAIRANIAMLGRLRCPPVCLFPIHSFIIHSSSQCLSFLHLFFMLLPLFFTPYLIIYLLLLILASSLTRLFPTPSIISQVWINTICLFLTSPSHLFLHNGWTKH